MPLSSIHSKAIDGSAGAWWWPLRWVLAAAEPVYALAVGRRNAAFDDGSRVIERVEVPVISVGNITAGGTGKTPLVIDLVQRLERMGRKVGVVSRGYKAAAGGVADELALVGRKVPGAICVANPDRVAGARAAIGRGADVIVLDDGFQHRRIGRDLDIVVIDATDPFGGERLLPRGRLREPVASLRRAGLVVVSRADAVDADVLSALMERVGRFGRSVTCRHAPAGVFDVDGGRCDVTVGRVFAFAGVGNPKAFEGTVVQAGLTVVGRRCWGDHHRYTSADLAEVRESVRRVGADFAVTTEKDAVKLVGLERSVADELRVLAIEIDYLDGGACVMDEVLASVCGR